MLFRKQNPSQRWDGSQVKHSSHEWGTSTDLCNSQTRPHCPGTTGQSTAHKGPGHHSPKELKLQQQAVCEPTPYCPACRTPIQAASCPGPEEGRAVPQPTEARGSFSRALLTALQSAEAIVKCKKLQLGCRTKLSGFALKSWMASACWPMINAESWQWTTDPKCVSTAPMPFCVLLTDPENGDNVSCYFVFISNNCFFLLLR